MEREAGTEGEMATREAIARREMMWKEEEMPK